jgi:hypothetical protein
MRPECKIVTVAVNVAEVSSLLISGSIVGRVSCRALIGSGVQSSGLIGDGPTQCSVTVHTIFHRYNRKSIYFSQNNISFLSCMLLTSAGN